MEVLAVRRWSVVPGTGMQRTAVQKTLVLFSTVTSVSVVVPEASDCPNLNPVLIFL